VVVFRRCRWRYIPTELGVRLFREPDAGNPPVRFDERGEETELSQTGLRRRGESPANRHREATVTAPLLDSTLHRHDFWRTKSAKWRERLITTVTFRQPAICVIASSSPLPGNNRPVRNGMAKCVLSSPPAQSSTWSPASLDTRRRTLSWECPQWRPSFASYGCGG